MKPRGYEAIKEVASEAGYAIPDMLVMARENDPFFIGSPAHVEKAQWFADLWRQFNYSTGVHLRRVHYQLVSQYTPTMHDGKPYENTEGCWKYLCSAGRFARILGLVDPEAFEDHRNPPPQILISDRWDGEPVPSIEIDEPGWTLPSITTDLGDNLYIAAPSISVDGYSYENSDQPYHIELWVEKSTVDDVLVPICRSKGANLVTGKGFQSITNAVNLLKRIADRGKPARIFYISDFDPAGDGMPVAVARQVEYWLETYAPEADIKLTPLVLTRDQVSKYRLPRIPLKDTDKRKGGFEDRHGEGAVELDALQSLYPGELARIVNEALAPYRDEDLWGKLSDTRAAATRRARQAWAGEIADERETLTALEAEAREVVKRYRARLEDLSTALEVDLSPIAERLEVVRQAIQDKIDDFDADFLPDRPDPDIDEPDESDWLFDAERDYFDQLEVYHAHQNGIDADD